MKKSEILKELKAIQEQMSECIVGAWNESLSDTTDAVLLETMNSDKYGEEVQCEYNGWNERLEKLVEALEKGEPTKMEVMIKNFHKCISIDDDVTDADIEAEILHLQNHVKEYNSHDTLDYVIGDKFNPIEKFEHSFTVKTFLDHIDTKGYE